MFETQVFIDTETGERVEIVYERLADGVSHLLPQAHSLLHLVRERKTSAPHPGTSSKHGVPRRGLIQKPLSLPGGEP